MITEYKLSHTAYEIEEKLGAVSGYKIIPLTKNVEDVVLTLIPDTNMKYSAEISTDCAFALPEVLNLDIDNSILIYMHFTDAVSVDWGSDVLFYNGEVPTINAGHYDIIFTFDPNAKKWTVGVLRKGAAEE